MKATSVRTDSTLVYLNGHSAGQPPIPADRHGLSTDYLNHYSEILMLIEMAPSDAGIVDEIGSWQPIGYRDYFLKSPLRRAGSAIAAYEALPDDRRTVFEQIVEALDKLTLGAILALQPPCHPQNMLLIGEVIGPGIRRLIDRAAAFLNSGGQGPREGCEADHAQRLTDRLISPAA